MISKLAEELLKEAAYYRFNGRAGKNTARNYDRMRQQGQSANKVRPIDANVAAQQAKPGFFRRALNFGKWLGSGALRFGFPAVTSAMTASDIASGQESVGGALGSITGSSAGWFGGQSLVGKITKNKPLGFIGGLAGSFVGDSLGRYIGDKIIPYRRTPNKVQEHV